MSKASLFALLVLASLTGCGETKKVLNPRVGTMPVLFESDGARDAFLIELGERYEAGAAKLPPGTLSRNAYFNREVVNADIDGDGIISDREAYRYIEE